MAFIVLEGLDGAGKSTQTELLRKKLEQMGKSSYSMHFPMMDSPRFGALISKFLRGEFGDNNSVDPYLVAALYAGDRFNSRLFILEKLKENNTVIIDRFVASNIAYQCAKISDNQQQKELMQWILDLEFNLYQLPKPDITFFFDVPFSFTKEKLTQIREGDDRNYLSGKSDIHEKDLSFQEKVKEVYLYLCDSQPEYIRIDCATQDKKMLNPDEIFNEVWNYLNEKKLI